MIPDKRHSLHHVAFDVLELLDLGLLEDLAVALLQNLLRGQAALAGRLRAAEPEMLGFEQLFEGGGAVPLEHLGDKCKDRLFLVGQRRYARSGPGVEAVGHDTAHRLHALGYSPIGHPAATGGIIVLENDFIVQAQRCDLRPEKDRLQAHQRHRLSAELGRELAVHADDILCGVEYRRCGEQLAHCVYAPALCHGADAVLAAVQQGKKARRVRVEVLQTPRVLIVRQLLLVLAQIQQDRRLAPAEELRERLFADIVFLEHVLELFPGYAGIGLSVAVFVHMYSPENVIFLEQVLNRPGNKICDRAHDNSGQKQSQQDRGECLFQLDIQQ